MKHVYIINKFHDVYLDIDELLILQLDYEGHYWHKCLFDFIENRLLCF